MGDTLTLQVGRRLTEDGYTFWQNTPYDPDALEQLDGTQTRTYTVVGVMERPSFEPYSAPGYTVVTRLAGRVPLPGTTPYPCISIWSIPAASSRPCPSWRKRTAVPTVPYRITKTYCVCRASVAITS